MSVEPAEGKAETGVERDGVQRIQSVCPTGPNHTLTWLLKFLAHKSVPFCGCVPDFLSQSKRLTDTR